MTIPPDELPPEPPLPPEPVPPPAQQAQVQTSDRLVLATGFFPGGSPDPATIEIVDLDESAWAEMQAAPPGQKHLAEDGTLTVIPPPPPPIEYTGSQQVKARVRTTDDVVLVVFTFPCEVRHRYRANMAISGTDAVSFASLEMEGRFAWKRGNANAVMVGGAGIVVVSKLNDAAAASWAPNCLPVGTAVEFSVKGAVGRTIDWLLTGLIEVFAPEGLVEA